MNWIMVLAIGLFALAWLTIIYQSQQDNWNMDRTVGMLVFLAGATCGGFLDNFLSAESSLLPWIEPISAVIMLVGLFIAWDGESEGDDP